MPESIYDDNDIEKLEADDIFPVRKLMDVGTQDLIEELKMRSTAMVVAMLSESGDDNELFFPVFHGSSFTCVGLIVELQNCLQRED